MDQKDCVFCKIIAGDIPSKTRYEDSDILAFDDAKPAAPVHVLVIPKMHVSGISEMSAELAGKLQLSIPKIAEKMGLDQNYQVNLNAGRYQEVPHLHYHLRGGE